ncbi:MAG TPA: secretin N-terminal domain-containing protein [Caulobacteraceae bacterium]|nr:secretin N-terminal domain-containing protein [Caulobacteraceae bacterium]
MTLDFLSHRLPKVWLALLVICLLDVWLGAGPVRGQTQPSPDPAFLTSVTVSDVSPTETDIVLTFTPAANKYSVIRNDSEQSAIAFALSSRGSNARVPTGLHGLVRSLDFEQNDTILILRLATTSSARITAAPVGNQSIALKVVASQVSPRAAENVQDGAGPLRRTTERPASEDGFELVPLKYADISEVVGLLTDGLSVKSNDTFIPREPAFGSSGTGGSGAFTPPPALSPEQMNQPLAQSVDDTIGVDRRLNAIILKGSPERIARLKEKIAIIDVPVGSVVLETIFVELTETAARNVGLDFNNANSQIGVATFGTGAFVPAGFPTGKGLTSVSLQTALYAQVQAGRARIVSKPRIAAQSGSTAKIITGDALPILTAITLSGVNGVSQQVQYVNVGVTLQIAPRISDDGFVTSHMFVVVSSVTGYSQGYPTISQREAETSATVQDGETFVIGGLTERNEIVTKGKIPGLGDIPGAGELFKLHRSSGTKTELYIVVTPHIVRRGDAKIAALLRDSPDAK